MLHQRHKRPSWNYKPSNILESRWLNKAKEMYHYCSLSCYVFRMDKFSNPFLMFHFRMHYVWPLQRQKELHGACNVHPVSSWYFDRMLECVRFSRTFSPLRNTFKWGSWQNLLHLSDRVILYCWLITFCMMDCKGRLLVHCFNTSLSVDLLA